MKRIIWLILKLIIIFFIAFIIYFSGHKEDWIFAVAGGLAWAEVVKCVSFAQNIYEESKGFIILAFVGTIIAGIVRVAANNTAGIVFYVIASISNDICCAMMSADDLRASYDRVKDTYNRRKQYSTVALSSAVSEWSETESRNKFFMISNLVIFGVLALVGCFKPWMSFLPLGYLVLRLIYFWIRSRFE